VIGVPRVRMGADLIWKGNEESVLSEVGTEVCVKEWGIRLDCVSVVMVVDENERVSGLKASGST